VTDVDPRIARLLDAYAVPEPPAGLRPRTLAAAAPLLAASARPDWRMLVRALGAALVPLPVVLLVDAFVVQVLWSLAMAVLPRPLGVYVVANYAALLAVLLALAYAAVPVLVGRQSRASVELRHA
jgi:hypothetical protein